MNRKDDKARVDRKRALAIAKIQEIAPVAQYLIGGLEEIKLDLLLMALAGRRVELSDEETP